MVHIASLHSEPPLLRKREKTIIRKGVIVREHIWVNAQGQEMKKQGDGFVPKESISLGPAQPSILLFSMKPPLPPQTTYPSHDMTLFLVVCVLFVTSGMFLGFLIGSKKKSHEPNPDRSRKADC